MPVERLDLQAKLLCSVLRFSSRQSDRLIVGVISVPDARQIAQNFAKELEALTYNDQPIRAIFFDAETFDQTQNTEMNVIYIAPGSRQFLEKIALFADTHKIFSCTGILEYVQQGKIALGFGAYEDKPQIVLNLPVAKRLDYEFKNPKFLNLQATRKLILLK